MYLLLRSSLVSLDSIEVVRIMLNRQLQYLFKILLFVWGVIKSKYESSIHFKYTNSLVNVDLFYANFTNTVFQKIPILHLTNNMKKNPSLKRILLDFVWTFCILTWITQSLVKWFFPRRALIWLNLYGHEAVRHKL